MVLGQLDGTIGEKSNLVTTSQQSTIDFVKVDTGMWLGFQYMALTVKGTM